MIRRPPRSPLFPNTTLFRSQVARPPRLQGQLQVGRVQVTAGGQGLPVRPLLLPDRVPLVVDRKSTRLNSSHANISYAVFCLKKKTYTRSRLIHTTVKSITLP